MLHPTRLPSRLAAVASLPFVGFTVTGIVRNSHPRSPGGWAAGASLRKYTHCSLDRDSILHLPFPVKLFYPAWLTDDEKIPLAFFRRVRYTDHWW